MKTPFFSVIIPTYNRSKLIGQVIESFLVQQFAEFELIVVDDGGNDETEQKVRAFGDERIQYIYKENGERGAARNFGAKLSKGEYVTFFDSDDVVYPFFLSHAYHNLQKLKFPPCYAQAFEVIPSAIVEHKEYRADDDKIILINQRLMRSNILACNGVFLRKDVAQRFRFSEIRDLSGSEDWLLWARVAANFPFHYSIRICSALVNHDERGELNLKAESLYKRLQILIRSFQTDEDISLLGKKGVHKIESSSHLFAALKLSYFKKFKFKSLQYLLKSFWLNPNIIKRKATYVALKKWITTWQK